MKDFVKKLSDSKVVTYILIAITMLLVCFYFIATKIDVKPDGDILWHYKLGEDICKTKVLSLDNPYTFLENTEWIPHEWLYEIFIYLILSATGAIGFCLLYAVNKICLFVVTYRLNKAKSLLSYLMVFILLSSSLTMNRGNRPAEFSVYFILCIFYFYWSKSRYKDIWYLLLGIFIANFHGGVAMIMIAIHFILLALDICVDVYEHLSINKSKYIRCLIDISLFILGCLINPAGYRLFTNSFLESCSSGVTYITEWLPTTFGYVSIFCVIVMVLSFGYALYKIKHENVNEHRMDIQKIGCLCALLMLSCVSQKAFILYFVVYCVFGYSYLCDMFHDFVKLKKLPIITKNVQLCFFNYFFGLICFMLLLDMNNDFQKNKYLCSFKSWMNNFYAENILEELKTNYTDDTRILTSYSYGNIILFNDMKCFVDTREWCYAKELGSCDAVDDLFYITHSQGIDKNAIDIFLDKYDFDYIWVNSELPLMTYMNMSDDYELVCTNGDENLSVNEIYDRNLSNYECLYKKVGEK